MIESRKSALSKVRSALPENSKWKAILASSDALVQVHLAVFVEPYLSLISDGKKTIESRFSKNCIAPFNAVNVGDIILLKRSGGGIAGICLVEKAWFYRLVPGTLKEIRSLFAGGICPAGTSFWDDRKDSSYCSLIWVCNFTKLPDIPFSKADRRGWVILK